MTDTETVERREWLIRKNGYFYRPNRAGYTTEKLEAGRYTKVEADREARIEPENFTVLHESEVPDVPEVVDLLRAALTAKDARIAELTQERDEAQERIDNAQQSMAETQPSWERRCYSIIASLGIDFGEPTPDVPEQNGWYARNLSAAEDRAFAAAAQTTTLQERVRVLEGALTPSADTKAAYMSEFSFGVTLRAGNQEDYRRVNVPWTTIKEIMTAIANRANAMEAKTDGK